MKTFVLLRLYLLDDLSWGVQLVYLVKEISSFLLYKSQGSLVKAVIGLDDQLRL
jgi:hypothetical protein